MRQDGVLSPKNPMVRKLELTPVMEEFSHLRITSTVKKARDDFSLSTSKLPFIDFSIPRFDEDVSEGDA